MKFQFTLALALGMTLGQLRASMSSAELTAWMAYNRVEPIGELRADLRNALQMHQTAEMHRDRKRKADPYKVEDFLPFRDKPPERAMSPQEFKQKWIKAFKRKD